MTFPPDDFNPMLTGMDYPQSLIDLFLKSIHPPSQVNVDKNQFVRGFLGCLSLSLFEKRRILNQTPNLSQIQIDGLQKGFADEIEQFSRLISEWSSVAKLCAKAWIMANEMARTLDADYSDAQEQQTLQAMLAAKYDSSEKRQWLQQALDETDSALVQHMFGFFLASHRHLEKKRNVQDAK